MDICTIVMTLVLQEKGNKRLELDSNRPELYPDGTRRLTVGELIRISHDANETKIEESRWIGVSSGQDESADFRETSGIDVTHDRSQLMH